MKKHFYFLFIFLIKIISAFAQNSCASAVNITPTTEAACGTDSTGVNKPTSFNPSGVNPTCGGNQDDWWGKFTANSSSMRVYFYNRSSGSTSMQLLSAPCGNTMTQIPGAGGCTNGNSDSDIPTVVDINTTVNAVYYIRIVRTNSNSSLTGGLCVYPRPPTNYYIGCDPLVDNGDDQSVPGGLANPVPAIMGRENQCTANAVTIGDSEYASGVTPLGCGASSQDDWWVKFTATATKTGINLYGTNPKTGVSTKNARTQVYTAPCGSSMTLVGCMGEDTEEFADFMQLTTVVNQTYYVRISRLGSNSDIDNAKLCIWADTVTYAPLNDCADNTDFNNGSRNGWTCRSGYYNFSYNFVNSGCLPNPNVNNATLFTVPDDASGNRHVITTSNAASASRDVHSANNITTLAPGGSPYSLRLGDAGTNCWGTSSPCPSLMESIKYNINVTAANAGFTFMYAAFLEDPGHPANAQPRFEVKLTDNAGNPLTCGSFKVIAGAGAGGTNSYFQGYENWKYSGWKTVPLDLTNYIGQTVGLEFITADCFPTSSAAADTNTTCTSGGVCTTIITACNGNTMQRCTTVCDINVNPDCNNPVPVSFGCTAIGTCTGNSAGSHSAYAYIDAFCVPMEIAAPTVCAGTASVQICAPSGYISYSWPAGQPGLSGSPTTQCVTINNPVPGNSYTVNLMSPTGCNSTVSTSLVDCSPAPIQLLSFSAKPASEKVNLFWTTASETDNDYFTIEKTQDSRIFLEVKRIRGAGNSTRTLQYSAIDEKPFDGLSYYRLKQTDYNGKFTYSHLVPIVMKESNKIGISYYFSSINGSELHYLISSAEDSESEISIEVLDMMGKRVYSLNHASPHGIINMSSFPKAMYILKAYDKNKQALTKFIH